MGNGSTYINMYWSVLLNIRKYLCPQSPQVLNQIPLSDSYTHLNWELLLWGQLQSVGSQEVGHNSGLSTTQHYRGFFPNEEILRNENLSACAGVNIECTLLFDKGRKTWETPRLTSLFICPLCHLLLCGLLISKLVWGSGFSDRISRQCKVMGEALGSETWS